MKKRLYRALAWLLCFMLSAGLTAAFAEDSAGEESASPAVSEEQQQEIAELLEDVHRFGYSAEVEKDQDGNIVRVNGFPLRKVRAGFNNVADATTFRFETDFVDYPFWLPSTQYDGNLAAMSLAMALSAIRADGYNDITKENYDPSINLRAFLEDAGFSDLRSDDYSRVPTMFTVSSAIGSRVMEAEGQEPFTLIAVGVCGGRYRNEWISNFTPGNGDIHEGFLSAARLVVDRLCGYIATRRITGRIKIWISGFSRAAAVSNLTASILNQTEMFPKEDVYAYTFATPAAVRNPPDTGYENIYNIINPMDLIPQVMPFVWGFSRYGKDLFLPVQEFSGYLGSYAHAEREEENRDIYGAISNYSPNLNFRLRLLYSLLLDLLESQENFNRFYQPPLASLLANKTVDNSLILLRSLMQSLSGIDRQGRINLDEVLDYSFRLLAAGATRSGLGGTDQNTGSLVYRLFSEHKENAYISNTFIIRCGLFEANERSRYVMVKGPVTLTIQSRENGAVLLTMDSDGKITAGKSLEGISETDDDENAAYLERIGKTSVAAIPAELDWDVSWTAEKDGSVEARIIKINARAATEYEAWSLPSRAVHAGDTSLILSSGADGGFTLVEGFVNGTADAREIAEYLGIANPGINWRVALICACAVLGLIICVILCVIASRSARLKKKVRFPVWALLCLFGIAALEAETAFWCFADQVYIRVIWKAVGGLSLLGVYWMTRRRNVPVLYSALPPLVIALVADMLISVWPAIGVAVFLVFHLSLSFLFMRQKPMSRRNWIQWAFISVLVTGPIILFYSRQQGALGWIVAAYAPVLLLTAISSMNQSYRLRAAAILFLVSDIMLGIFVTQVKSPELHASYMLLFAIALLVLAVSHPHGKKAGTGEKPAQNAQAQALTAG